MNIIGHKKIYLFFAFILVSASVASILVFGFRYGIDIVGGTLWQIKFIENKVSAEALNQFIASELKVEGTQVASGSTESLIIRAKEISEENHQEYLAKINSEFGAIEELRFETIGSVIGQELRDKAIKAFILVLFAISLYIAFVFRKVSRPVSSWKYGVVTLITLFHDAIIPIGVFAFLGYLYGVEIDINFIVAVLVVMGFSVHDTIVVFDRIRENLKFGSSSKDEFNAVVNASVNQTIARSINTSLTLLFVLFAIYFLGAITLKYFILTIIIGTVVGTYSSIFIASPLLTLWRRR